MCTKEERILPALLQARLVPEEFDCTFLVAAVSTWHAQVLMGKELDICANGTFFRMGNEGRSSQVEFRSCMAHPA